MHTAAVPKAILGVMRKGEQRVVKEILGDASAGVAICLMTTDRKWVTKLIELNGDKPLAGIVGNKGCNGILETPLWNELAWDAPQLR
jgi:hypothetical protein